MTSMLHLLNGDATAERLRPAGIPGTLAVWADVLYEGPVPRDPSSAEGVRTRARVLAERGYAGFEEAVATGERWNRALETAGQYDEVVIWLEHDLFDQLLLLHHLAWFRRRPPGRTRISLICIGDHPEVEHFKGLGQLTPDQLAPLLHRRAPIDARGIEIGGQAWDAFTAADPTALQQVADGDPGDFPYLAPALRRFLEEYPSVRDGLSRSERLILESLSTGRKAVVEVFRSLHRRERFFYETDLSLAHRLREMSGGAHPLVAVETGPEAGGVLGGSAELAPAGREVLEGRADRVRLRGIDRWMGGVHLQGREPEWRWDADAARLVRAGA